MLAASSAPFVTTASASSALKENLAGLSPLATGLEIQGILPSASSAAAEAGIVARRQAAIRTLTDRLHLEPPVFTEQSDAPVAVSTSNGDQPVTLMARTGALGHVKILSQTSGDGVWVSDLTAKPGGIRPGGKLRIVFSERGTGETRSATVRVKGIYQALDSSVPGPYWANLLPEIIIEGADPPPPQRFVLMSPTDLYALSSKLSHFSTIKANGHVYSIGDGPTLRTMAELSVSPQGMTSPRQGHSWTALVHSATRCRPRRSARRSAARRPTAGSSTRRTSSIRRMGTCFRVPCRAPLLGGRDRGKNREPYRGSRDPTRRRRHADRPRRRGSGRGVPRPPALRRGVAALCTRGERGCVRRPDVPGAASPHARRCGRRLRVGARTDRSLRPIGIGRQCDAPLGSDPRRARGCSRAPARRRCRLLHVRQAVRFGDPPHSLAPLLPVGAGAARDLALAATQGRDGRRARRPYRHGGRPSHPRRVPVPAPPGRGRRRPRYPDTSLRASAPTGPRDRTSRRAVSRAAAALGGPRAADCAARRPRRWPSERISTRRPSLPR